MKGPWKQRKRTTQKLNFTGMYSNPPESSYERGFRLSLNSSPKSWQSKLMLPLMVSFLQTQKTLPQASLLQNWNITSGCTMRTGRALSSPVRYTTVFRTQQNSLSDTVALWWRADISKHSRAVGSASPLVEKTETNLWLIDRLSQSTMGSKYFPLASDLQWFIIE